MLCSYPTLHAQLPVASSPAKWLYPLGNSEATRTQDFPSARQTFDTIVRKWSTAAIAGDIEPLIGNIINNPKLAETNPYAPQEIVAVVGGQLIILDATGRTQRPIRLPSFIRSVSCLLDSSVLPTNIYAKFPSLIALESIENKNVQDSLAFGYIYGHDTLSDSVAFIQRLAVDIRPYSPNYYAGIKPVFATPQGNSLLVTSIANTSIPTIGDAPPLIPYFRGVAQFRCGLLEAPFPNPDAGDTIPGRATFGPDIAVSQPSITRFGSRTSILLPCYPSRFEYSMPYPFRPLPTFSNRPYLIGLDIQNTQLSEAITPVDLTNLTGDPFNYSRPRIKPYFVSIRDAGSGGAQGTVVLTAEEYLGRDSSLGRARLHIYATNGDPITSPTDPTNVSFTGGFNHAWSVGVGNLDGNDTNRFLPFYPHNPGNEIAVTQSTREFAFPGSKLMILRYRSGTPVRKPAPLNSFLNPLDTIVTAQITGWLACIADVDNNGDGKSEIFLADGGELYVLRMRDYIDTRFRSQAAFDTVFRASFPTETINHVAVADVDGDSYADILITTNVRTYMYGMFSSNAIAITTPSRTQNSTTAFCRGDSASLTWKNVFRGQPAVRVLFQEYRLGSPSGAPTIVAASVTNDKDSIVYRFRPDTSLAGKFGRFVVQSTATPYIQDSSAFVEFLAPFMRFDSETKARGVIAGEINAVRGKVRCLDSLRLFASLDSGITWTPLGTTRVYEPDSVFQFDAQIPCPTFFNALRDRDSIIRLRAEGFKRGIAGTVRSDTVAIRIRPRQLVTRIYDAPSSLARERNYLWLVPPDSGVCDSVTLAISYDYGRTYQFVDKLPRSQNEYTYLPATTTPDTVVLRIACDGSCYRTDTMIVNARSPLIHAVVPNPFDPATEVCEIFSAPPVNATATVRIYDQNNRIITEIIKSEARTANRVYRDAWDGMNDSGKPVAIGMYYVLVEFSDGSREFYPVFVRKQ